MPYMWLTNPDKSKKIYRFVNLIGKSVINLYIPFPFMANHIQIYKNIYNL